MRRGIRQRCRSGRTGSGERRAIAWLAAVCLAGATGCATGAVAAPTTSAPPTAHNGPAIGALPVIASAADIRLPLDAYALSDTQLAEIDGAVNSYVHLCLRRLGFDLPSAVFSQKYAGAGEYRLRLISVAEAQASGYRSMHVGAAVAAVGQPAPPTAIEAWQGSVAEVDGKPVPQGGCEAWGNRAVRTPNLPLDVRDVVQQVELQVLSDTRMVSVFSAWSTCMSVHGFHYPTPMDAQDGYPGGWPARADATEVSVATADVACRQRTGVMETWAALMAAYEKQVIATMQPQLVAAHAVTDGWLHNAAGAPTQAFS
jgi:hypothetical protein